MKSTDMLMWKRESSTDKNTTGTKGILRDHQLIIQSGHEFERRQRGWYMGGFGGKEGKGEMM